MVVNALKQRTLVLRNLGLIAIENLGVCKDQVECIDLTENDISKLDNMPALTRLKTLILANNKISFIDADVIQNLSNLVALVLTNNRFTSLMQLEPLKGLKHLERISLAGNPLVDIEKNYVKNLAEMLPSLRFVDALKINRT